MSSVYSHKSENGTESLLKAVGTICRLYSWESDVSSRWTAGHSFELGQALNSCVGEGLERYGTAFIPHRSELIKGSHSELKKSHNILPIDYLQLYSKEQIQRLKLIENRFNKFRNISEDDQIEWIGGKLFDEVSETKVIHPFQLLRLDGYYGAPYELPTTNGVALGNSYEMAFNNALAEFLERDAFLKHWWLMKAPPHYSSTDLLKLPLGPTLEVIEGLQNRIVVLDLSEIWDVPIFTAMAWGQDDRKEPALIVAGACGTNPKETLVKAIGELTRIFTTIAKNIRSKKSAEAPKDAEKDICDFKNIISFYSEKKSAQQAQFLLSGPRPGADGLRKLMAKYEHNSASLKSRVFKKQGQILSFDLTPIDLALGGLSVVRVVVPQGLPLNAAHALRPFGHPVLNKYGDNKLNPYPHPYA